MRPIRPPRCVSGDDPAVHPPTVLFEGRLWCAECASILIDRSPAIAYFELIGEPLPKAGMQIRFQPKVAV